jgi:O-antigen/teichoic acid export membrane protein
MLTLSPESVQQFLALAIGFAFAGAISTGYQLVTKQPVSFRLLEQGPHPGTFAAVPMLVFAAPFIIMRNTIRGRQIEGRRMHFVMVATVISGIWSILSGTAVVMALQFLGVFS